MASWWVTRSRLHLIFSQIDGNERTNLRSTSISQLINTGIIVPNNQINFVLT